MPKRLSLDEVLEKRKESVRETAKGDAITKAAFRAPSSWDKIERSARYVMSSQKPDRYLDVVMIGGMDTANFEQNPVCLAFHQSRDWPIGLWRDLEKVMNGRPPRLEGTVQLAQEGTTEQADTAALLISQGLMRACSIGFIPTDVEPIYDQEDNWTGGFRFVESELVECSVVPVPAHPSALVKSAKGDPNVARELLEQEIESWCREWTDIGFSREEFEAAWRKFASPTTTVTLGNFKASDDWVKDPRPAQEEKTVEVPREEQGMIGWLGKMFGLKVKEAEIEKIEPTIEKPEPVMADPEKAAALKAAAKEMRDRISARNIL